MCHVMVTLRSRDFFGRVVINPQEAMMVLCPEERVMRAHTHTQTHRHTHGGWLGETGIAVSCVDFKDFTCFIEIQNLSNHKVILVLYRNIFREP